MTTVKNTPDLYEAKTPQDWDERPLQAFDTWLMRHLKGRGGKDREIRQSTCVIYNTMWASFVHWITAYRIPLSRVTPAHLDRFLADNEDKRNHRERYRKLIERVLVQVHTTLPYSQNPAVAVLRDDSATWKQADSNRPMSFFTPSERDTIVQWLLQPISENEQEKKEKKSHKDFAHTHWREVRDRALVGILLGAGLKVSECRGLTVNNILMGDEVWINLRKPDSQLSHRTMPLPFARELLTRWLAVRAAVGCMGDLVFPSKLNGSPMHAITLVRICEAVTDACGITDQEDDVPKVKRETRASPQTMRNSFAATLFEAGESAKSVSDSLGFTLITGERMKVAWQAWQVVPGSAPGAALPWPPERTIGSARLATAQTVRVSQP
ncbi:hypothetical protein A9R05_44210 (plasmid) [Burkholderia sp. KK1]|uniref:Phage integrase family protein n=1 Tax=Burkholderia sp. M701 TaxID=326454 RepID=V5YQI0_9BURK|nr:site-specific integrase [Burkholderia sp. M701]AQH05961.1 hypothetical protein A9R05_44210 [Burkholderia sp. KK1]BAO19191.1 putative phage integrase family protein [Burkholderia sp. M701]